MISVIIPAYNEAENINLITKCISEQLEDLGDYEIIFIDDGSTDATLENIKKLVDSEIESRDEHSTKIDEPNIDDNKSNVKLF